MGVHEKSSSSKDDLTLFTCLNLFNIYGVWVYTLPVYLTSVKQFSSLSNPCKFSVRDYPCRLSKAAETKSTESLDHDYCWTWVVTFGKKKKTTLYSHVKVNDQLNPDIIRSTIAFCFPHALVPGLPRLCSQ